MPKDHIGSPSIRTTPGAVGFGRLALDDRLEQDYAQAARSASRNQRMLEEAARQSGQSVEDYMRENDMLSCMDYKSRPIESMRHPRTQ